jgi:hypothetical protein
MTARTISARWSLGVVGGLGPLARADVFFKLIKATPARSYAEQLDVVFEQHPFRNARASRAATTERKLDIFDMIRDFERRGARQWSCLALVQIGGPVEAFRIAKDILSSRQDGIPHSGCSGIFEA